MSEEQQSISQALHAARERRGLDLDTVYRQTGISLPVLQGMENDGFDVVEPVFARMALQSYAEYLDLDVESLIARFNQEYGPVQATTPIAAPNATATPTGSGPSLPFDNTTLLTIGIGVGALILLLLAISLFDDSGDPKAVQAPPPEPERAFRSESMQKVEPENRVDPVQRAELTRIVTTPEPSFREPLTTAETNDSAIIPQDTTPETSPTNLKDAQHLAPPSLEREEEEEEERPVTESNPAAIDTPASAEANIAPAQASSSRPPQDQQVALTARTPTDPSAAPAPADNDEETRPQSAIAETLTPATDRALVGENTKPLSQSQIATSQPSGVVLAVEAIDSTWVQIRWDGKRTFEGIVPRGERRIFAADEYFLVLSGRAHGLHYWLNDELLGEGQLGEATKILRFRATIAGIEFLGPDFAPLTATTPADGP